MEQKLNIDLSKTTAILSEDGNQIFSQGIILRKVSRFITGTPQDGTIPIEIFYDVKTGKILKESLPPQLWSEFFPENKGLIEGVTEDKPKKSNLTVVR